MARHTTAARRQKPLKGGRDPLFSCVHPEIRRRIERRAVRTHMRRSFVVAVLLAHAVGFNDEDAFDFWQEMERQGD